MKRKVISVFLVGALVAGLAGCGIGQQDADGDLEQETETEEYIDPSTLRSDFTEEELADGHASFRVSRYLWVEADVTPAEDYADGLGSYYMEKVPEDGSLEEFTENPRMFGQSVDDFLQSVSDVLGFSIPADQLEWYIHDSSTLAEIASLSAADGNSYEIFLNWDGDAESAEYYASSPSFRILQLVGDDTDSADDLDNETRYWTSDFPTSIRNCERFLLPETDETYLLTDEQVADWKETLENLMGCALSDTWDCTHVTDDKLEALLSLKWISSTTTDATYQWNLWNTYSTGPVDLYYFYHQIDGVPVENLSLTYVLQEGETRADDVSYTDYNDTEMIYANNQSVSELLTDGSQVLFLDFGNDYQPGEVYRETQPILSPSEALQKV